MMMTPEEFRNMFLLILTHRLHELCEKNLPELSVRIDEENGPTYKEIDGAAACRILDGGEIHAAQDMADPTVMVSDWYACSLFGITTFHPSEYAADKDSPNEVLLLVRDWSVADFLADWTKLDPIDIG